MKIICNSLVLLSMLSLIESMVCPDKTSKCKEGMTCCHWSSGTYGCCPLASAECCADGLHCCPNGTKCNDKSGSCDEFSAHIKPIALKSNVKSGSDELCPDKNQTCLQSETCCKEKSGGYGCCPYTLGVCCRDGLHCCPHSTRCDLIHKQCVRPTDGFNKNRFNSLNERMVLIGFEAKNITDIVCPGGRYDCPDGNTCCQINDTQWGCCPLLNAVCCKDRIHCCPNDTKCTQRGCQSL